MSELCDLADVKQRMPELGTSDDILIADLILAVSAYFERMTGRSFGTETSVRYFTGNGTNQVFVQPSLSTTPTLVRVRTNTVDAWRTVPAADIRLLPEGRAIGEPILWLEIRNTPTGIDSVFPMNDDTVEITGTWGLTNVPDDIRAAVASTVVNLYRARGSAGADIETGVGGTYMPDIPKALPSFAYSILRSYKRMVFA